MKATSTIKRKSDRISTDGFNEISFANSSKNKNFEGVKVRTFEFAKSIKQRCIKRPDHWGLTVLGRVEYKMSALYSADYVYHRSCCIKCRNRKKVKVHSSVELS